MKLDYTDGFMRKFEIPYNFDPNYLVALEACGLINNEIKYIYIQPFLEDYFGVNRLDIYGAYKLTREEYTNHMINIRKYFDGKMQLLLQNKEKIMPIETLKWYIDLGFTAFCCGNPEQAKLIKEYDANLTVIGSIVLHYSEEVIKKLSLDQTIQYFDTFVLDFSFCKDIQHIKLLPKKYNYMILANALCNTHCRGDHHWFKKDMNEPNYCPGKLGDYGILFEHSTLIRPMDLKYFDPYIDTYKLGDRSWETQDIIRDIILYTTDYSYYPGIIYDESMYEIDSATSAW